MPKYDNEGIENRSFLFESATNVSSVTIKDLHYHSLYEIYFMCDGSANYFIDDKIYEVSAGDVVFVPEGAIHKTVYLGGEHSRKLINCSSHFLPASLKGTVFTKPILYKGLGENESVKELFERIESEHLGGDDYSYDAIRCYMRLLFILLARNFETSYTKSVGSKLIEGTIGYIKGKYNSNITLSEIARVQGVSAEHLSRRFKKETGFGVNEYLTLVRLRQAARCLSEWEDATVSDIAYICGFNDSNYFSYKFKEAYGVSPLKFKKGGR